MESLEHVEHRPVLVIEESASDVHTEIRRDADEVLVECPVVDRAEAQAVGDDGLSQLLGVADDVRCVEEPDLAQSADRTALVIRGEDGATELRLVDALLDLPDDVPSLDRSVASD